MNDIVVQKRVLRVARGTPDRLPLELDMSLIDEADGRLGDVRMVSNVTKSELGGLYNQAANTTSKYLAWIEYEILKAKKEHDLDRAEVILDKVPLEAARLKELGMKMNEDMREALIIRDEACSTSLDVLNSLLAVKKLLEASYWTFIRAHNSIEAVSQHKSIAPTPNFSSGYIGQTFEDPQQNLMGRDERKY